MTVTPTAPWPFRPPSIEPEERGAALRCGDPLLQPPSCVRDCVGDCPRGGGPGHDGRPGPGGSHLERKSPQGSGPFMLPPASFLKGPRCEGGGGGRPLKPQPRVHLHGARLAGWRGSSCSGWTQCGLGPGAEPRPGVDPAQVWARQVEAWVPASFTGPAACGARVPMLGHSLSVRTHVKSKRRKQKPACESAPRG